VIRQSKIINSKTDALQVAARHLQVARPSCASCQDNRIEL
jgi:hypothetical protein